MSEHDPDFKLRQLAYKLKQDVGPFVDAASAALAPYGPDELGYRAAMPLEELKTDPEKYRGLLISQNVCHGIIDNVAKASQCLKGVDKYARFAPEKRLEYALRLLGYGAEYEFSLERLEQTDPLLNRELFNLEYLERFVAHDAHVAETVFNLRGAVQQLAQDLSQTTLPKAPASVQV